MEKNEDVIYIYDKQNVPFGSLSNNYFNYFDLYGKKWTTVTNFIFSNMLINENYRSILQHASIEGDKNVAKENKWKIQQMITNKELLKNAPCTELEKNNIIQMVNFETNIKKRNIKDVFDYYYGLEIRDTIKKACYDAYKSKIQKNEELTKLLLDTKNSKLLYISPTNNFDLGVNNDLEGHNFIGKALMQIRHEIIQKKNFLQDESVVKKTKEKIFFLYRILYIFNYQMLVNGDLYNCDISNYEVENENYSPILTSALNLMKRRINKNFKIPNFDLEEIFSKFQNGKLEYLTEYLNEKNLYNFFRLRNSDEILKNLTYKKELLIFETFLKNLIIQQKPTISEKELDIAVNELSSQAPNFVEYTNKFEKVVNMYKKFPPELYDKINKELYDTFLTDETFESLKKLKSLNKKYTFTQIKKSIKNDFNYDDDSQILDEKDQDEKNTYKLFVLIKGDKKQKVYKEVETIVCKNSKLLKKVKKILEDGKYYTTGALGKKIFSPFKISKKGNYLVKINNREQNFEYQPTQKQIQKLLSEFNSQSQNGEYFELKNVQIIDLDVKNEEVKNEEVNQINNEIIFIYGDLNYDSPYKKLSPLYGSTKNDFFIVDNLYYPNISIYISTCLLANQGMAIDHKKKLVYKRGMTIRDARSLLIIQPKEQLIYKEKIEGPKDMITNVIIDEQGFQHYYENQNIDEKTNSFYLPGDADFICKKVEQVYYFELMKILQILAIGRKFQNPELSNILLLTENARLIYDDKNDSFLGVGMEGKGENFCGLMLENQRKNILAYNIANEITFKSVHSQNVVKFISSDFLFDNWVKKRVNDMFDNSQRFCNYVNHFSDLNIELDEKFVESSIDSIFNPCLPLMNLMNKTSLPVPSDEFKNFIRDIYYDEIDMIISQTSKKQEIETSNFQKSSETPSDEKFEEKQRIKKERFILQLNMSRSEKEINAEIENIEKTVSSLIKTQPKMADKIRLVAEEKINEVKRNSTLSQDEKKKKMEEFQILQDKEKADFKNEVDNKNSIKNELKKNFKTNIEKIQSEGKEKILQIKETSKKITNIFWERIITMVYFLIKNTKETDEQKLRKLLYKLQRNLSQTEQNCQIMDKNILQDPYENCICSALINVICTVRNFRKKYIQEDFPLGKIDFELASSVILNSDIGDLLFEKMQKKKSEQTKLEDLSNEDELFQKLKKQLENYLENDPESKKYFDNEIVENETETKYEENMEEEKNEEDSENEKDYEGGEDEEERGNDDFGDADFGFVDKSLVLNTIILELDSKLEGNDLIDMTNELENHIELIKNYKMDENIKRNRINFFSTTIKK